MEHDLYRAVKKIFKDYEFVIFKIMLYKIVYCRSKQGMQYTHYLVFTKILNFDILLKRFITHISSV